jgi:hypothetical protein
MARYRIVFRCKHCGNAWAKICATPDPKQPRCPNLDCKKVHRDIGFDPGLGTAPAAVGMSNTTKAIDLTAEITMKTYGLTDLKDNLREGESMAPKLPAPQQQQVDTFFEPQKNPRLSGRRARYLDQLGKRAIAGQFRNTALDVKSVLPDARVGLRLAGTQKLQDQK